MAAVDKVLVVGGGFSGIAAAIQIAKKGISVDLLEIDPDWRPLGAGISISGATLRALDELGVYEDFLESGFISDGVELFSPTGHKIATLPSPRPVESKVAGGGGIMRPELAKLLANKTRQLGVNVRLGCSYKKIHDDGEKVLVKLLDDTESTYDLVVAAEGINSKIREEYFPEVKKPEYIGQVVWRAVMPRPDEIVCTRMWLSDHIKLGVNPVSKSHMYMFITEDRLEKEDIDKALWPELFAKLMDLFPDPLVKGLRTSAFESDANIDYRPLTNILVPRPWNRGRLIMIGDAVAATTPHLASGAGIGIESGIVLAEELAGNNDLQLALDSFHQRRWERCRLVVENSARLCRIEINGGDKKEHAAIMGKSMAALREAI